MSDPLTKLSFQRRSDKPEEKGEPASREIGKAATLVMLQPSAPAREPTAWMHAPSQPLMRSLLSQIQTPTAPRRTSRFFRVWLLVRSPCRADHSAYFGVARFISPILSAVDASQIKQSLYRCQCNSQGENEISVNGIVEKVAGSGSLPASCCLPFRPTCALSCSDSSARRR
jgi:hypothetical protein